MTYTTLAALLAAGDDNCTCTVADGRPGDHAKGCPAYDDDGDDDNNGNGDDDTEPDADDDTGQVGRGGGGAGFGRPTSDITAVGTGLHGVPTLAEVLHADGGPSTTQSGLVSANGDGKPPWLGDERQEAHGPNCQADAPGAATQINPGGSGGVMTSGTMSPSSPPAPLAAALAPAPAGMVAGEMPHFSQVPHAAPPTATDQQAAPPSGAPAPPMAAGIIEPPAETHIAPAKLLTSPYDPARNVTALIPPGGSVTVNAATGPPTSPASRIAAQLQAVRQGTWQGAVPQGDKPPRPKLADNAVGRTLAAHQSLDLHAADWSEDGSSS